MDPNKFTVHKLFNDLEIGTIFKQGSTIYEKIKDEQNVAGNVRIVRGDCGLDVIWKSNCSQDVWVEKDEKIIDLI